MSDEKKNPTVSEVGRLGGKATKAKHGEEHYRAIGRKGGQRTKELLDRAKALEAADQQPPLIARAVGQGESDLVPREQQ